MASFNLREPKTQRLLLTGLLSAGALYAFFATSFLPVNYPAAAAQIKSLKSDFERKSSDLAGARQSVADLPRFQSEFAALHERYEMAAELLPAEREMPGILRRLTLAGQQCGVRFEAFKPDPEIVKDHYSEMPIQITVTGGYHQVGQFLSEIANMARIMTISNVQLMTYDKGDELSTTEARFIVSAYTLEPATGASSMSAAGGSKETTANPGGSNAGTAK